MRTGVCDKERERIGRKLGKKFKSRKPTDSRDAHSLSLGADKLVELAEVRDVRSRNWEWPWNNRRVGEKSVENQIKEPRVWRWALIDGCVWLKSQSRCSEAHVFLPVTLPVSEKTDRSEMISVNYAFWSNILKYLSLSNKSILVEWFWLRILMNYIIWVSQILHEF